MSLVVRDFVASEDFEVIAPYLPDTLSVATCRRLVHTVPLEVRDNFDKFIDVMEFVEESLAAMRPCEEGHHHEFRPLNFPLVMLVSAIQWFRLETHSSYDGWFYSSERHSLKETVRKTETPFSFRTVNCRHCHQTLGFRRMLQPISCNKQQQLQ
eukprot:GILJ01014974.1.p2 GENE.GILJ01014974.1~~GILJ01014974.1.p2  ORF type:complete len:154 (-),score=11.00 GILJ01014974.1:22-483(-)